jgi:Holliday junction DNA helicase RuvA
MIAYLRGRVAAAREGRAVIEVGGVGYQLFISSRDLAILPSVGEEVLIHTYLSVREDAMLLYGFLSEDDLEVFRLLIAVPGVGPKGALGILGAMSANDIRFAVFSDDVKALSAAPGIGKKTAQKMILELKDKLKLEDALAHAAEESIPPADQTAGSGGNVDVSDAVQALVALGYSGSEALRAVKKVKIEEGMGTQEILKNALRFIGL